MSRPQVTITLGRSGQVVKKGMPDSDASHSDYASTTGSKRPIRERLGSNTDNPLLYGGQLYKKRSQRCTCGTGLRNEGLLALHSPRQALMRSQRRLDVDNDRPYISNAQVGQDDLRFKLMRKGFSRRDHSSADENSGVDLRQKLSRTTKAPPRIGTQQLIPEPRRIPPTRSADDLLQMDSLRKSYSAWTLDGLRHRSPDRILGSSRGISSPGNVGDLRQAPPTRSTGVQRSNTYMTQGAVNSSRPIPFMAKAPVTREAAKPVRLPPAGMMDKPSYAAVEPVTVSGLLHSLGLGKYAILFQAEEVDMAALKQMGDNDLKELGIPMGPRKKILLALLACSKPRQVRPIG